MGIALDYGYETANAPHGADYLLPTVKRVLADCPTGARLFDLGCGNGFAAHAMAGAGFSVTAVDTSQSGVAIACKAYPECRFEVGSAYADLAAMYGTFDVVLSLEVVEHLYDPRAFARTVRRLLEPKGIAVISTPYHGYLKNLALAVTGKWGAHHSPLWDGGHIKFWSRDSLAALFAEVGLREVAFHRVGRIAPLAKSMIMVVSPGA
jgi:2-polyprenyl-3-methyl-5-hydroxy-6-metoxy-1,4-benzoquinol methylase